MSLINFLLFIIIEMVIGKLDLLENSSYGSDDVAAIVGPVPTKTMFDLWAQFGVMVLGWYELEKKALGWVHWILSMNMHEVVY